MKMRLATLLLTILCLALSATGFAGTLYDNGPTNGTSDAYFVDVYQVSDTFVSNASPMNGFTFAEWVLQHTYTIPIGGQWAVGTTSFGNQIGSGFASGENFTPVLLCTSGQPFNGGICGGGFGYDVYDVTVNTGNLDLTAGNTYYLTLTGLTDSSGGRDGWDINSGPSLAYHNLLGQVPSESFTILGGSSSTTPEPSSIMLFGSGILGVAGILRRRLTR
jgi:PEP-CTERM motif